MTQQKVDISKNLNQNHDNENTHHELIRYLINLYNQKKFFLVIKHAEIYIKENPHSFDIWNLLAATKANVGMLNEVINIYKKIISMKGDYPEAYNNIGNALHKQKKFDKAVDSYKKAIELKPNYTNAYMNMGNTLLSQKKFNMAVETYKKVIELDPNYLNAYKNLGFTLTHQGKFDEAIEAYKKLISIKPDSADAYYNLGNVLHNQGKLDEAIKAYDKTLSFSPNHVDAYINKGTTLKNQDNLDEAIDLFKKAISIKFNNPEAHQNLSLTLLNAHRYREGFDEYEWRWRTKKFISQKRSFSKPLWDGKKSLNKKRILLWSEQGIGDTINWSSCISLLSSKTKHCILECQEKLVPLLKRSFPNVKVKPENNTLDSKRDDFDFHLPLGSLYKYFFKEILKKENAKPHLIPTSERVKYWRKRLLSLGKGPYVGISWKSSNVTFSRKQNYAPLSNWTSVLKIPEVTFINLQYKDFKDDLIKIKNQLGVKVHNFEDLDQYNDIDEVAALCAALDIVVSIKSSVPLITSGVGTKTLLLNWRQSAWNNVLFNPNGSQVEIFERNTWEQWDDVFYKISEKIKDRRIFWKK